MKRRTIIIGYDPVEQLTQAVLKSASEIRKTVIELESFKAVMPDINHNRQKVGGKKNKRNWKYGK